MTQISPATDITSKLTIVSLADSVILSFQLEDGDIICYQKYPTLEIADLYRYPDVPSFLDYVHNRQVYGVDIINTVF